MVAQFVHPGTAVEHDVESVGKAFVTKAAGL